MRRALSAVWEFVVGEDPLVALGVALAIGLTALLRAWWVMPPAVAALLAHSLRRASGRQAR